MQKQETRNKKQETRNKKQETRNKKQETRNKRNEHVSFLVSYAQPFYLAKETCIQKKISACSLNGYKLLRRCLYSQNKADSMLFVSLIFNLNIGVPSKTNAYKNQQGKGSISSKQIEDLTISVEGRLPFPCWFLYAQQDLMDAHRIMAAHRINFVFKIFLLFLYF